MIEINDISKVFRTSEVETVALNHVNLEVKEGEFAAIMGPSGCGKSTLLNILGLLDNPTEGSYKLLGQEVGNLKEKERTRVRKGKLGFVFQSFNLIDELNVYENVELPLTYLGISNINIQKKERLITDEVTRNQGGTIASRYSRLESRRQAVNKINAMFGTNIEVNYREDFQQIDNDTIPDEAGADTIGGAGNV